MEFNQLFGKYIKNARKNLGITQEEAAYRANISTRSISRIENGEVDPMNYSIFQIEKALQINISTIYDRIRKEMQQLEND